MFSTNKNNKSNIHNSIQPSVKSSITIPHYVPPAGDYIRLDQNTQAGLMEIQGHRSNQQDQLAVKHVPGFKELTSDEQQALLKSTVKSMQRRFGSFEQAQFSGSTLCSATAWVDDNDQLQAVSANLGDSQAYIVIVDEDGKVIENKRLNTNLHNLEENHAERQRMIASDRPLKKDANNVYRTYDGGLALSRSIGDPTILTEMSDHIPEVDCLTDSKNNKGIKLQKNQKAFLVVACDGLTEMVYERTTAGGKERPAVTTTRLGNAISTHRDSPTEAAHELIRYAYLFGSKDNISLSIVPIMKNKPAVSASVFDGHGPEGEVVSGNLEKHFLSTLFKKMLTVQKNALKSAKSPSDFLTKLKNYLENPRLDQQMILRLFNKMQNADGKYKIIHSSNSNAIATLFNHLQSKSSYQKALVMLKNAYCAKGLLAEDSSNKKREKAFFDYIAKNKPARHEPNVVKPAARSISALRK